MLRRRQRGGGQRDIERFAFENPRRRIVGAAERHKHHLHAHAVQFARQAALVALPERQQAGQHADSDSHAQERQAAAQAAADEITKRK